jgi:uncharacterized repeat protein (TIGR01451 family)
MNRFLITLASVAFGLVSVPASAGTDAVSLTSDVKVDKVVTENGRETHVMAAPEKVVPGDKLVFSTQFHNNGSSPVDSFVVTNPLPAGVAYSTEGSENAVVSVDGGKTWGPLASLTVADGKGGQRAAQATDVTHVRWSIPVIAPGASGTVSYHAIVR